MILARLEQYIREHRRTALYDMALGLNASPDALRGMLDILEHKGKVRRLPAGSTCGGGCTKCQPATIELYEWNDTQG